MRLAWQHQPQLDRVDPHHAIFVYDSVTPHLRLSWVWEARAAFGPVEHHVSVANLSGKEFWLPLVDSLRVNWTLAGHGPLSNFYVEKGANTPSPEGTHLLPIADGYQWTGLSSTYARPLKGQPREIIPAEFVYSSAGARNGWFAGIEFSGRTRVHLQRNGDQLESVLGLNPDPGPFRTRLVKDDALKRRALFWAPSPAALTVRATSFVSGCAPCLVTPMPGRIRTIRSWSTTAGAAACRWMRPLPCG